MKKGRGKGQAGTMRDLTILEKAAQFAWGRIEGALAHRRNTSVAIPSTFP